MDHAAVRAVGANEFDDLLARPGDMLVMFSAPWCAVCRGLAPDLQELGARLGPNLQIAKVSVDDNPALAQRYGVQSVPTVLMFRDGQLLQTSHPRTRADLAEVLTADSVASAGSVDDAKEATA
jgi:thioredoxin 1